MHLRPIEHLENCKMHTQDSLHVFFVFYNWTTKKTEPNWQFFSKLNWNQNRTRSFSQNQTELEKSNPHIPNIQIDSFVH